MEKYFIGSVDAFDELCLNLCHNILSISDIDCKNVCKYIFTSAHSSAAIEIVVSIALRNAGQ